MPKDISADSRIEVTAGKPVELPNGDFVANAQMSREGMDLHLTSPDGHTITVEGYFAQEPAPDLVTADGARLSPHLVNSFLPPEHAGQYAASGQIANDASPSGRITEVSGEAHITRADGTHMPATVGTPVYQGDVVETSKTGAVNIQFADNTYFAVSENARMSVDKFVYDSANHSGSSFFSMLQGVFVYTSGLIGKADPGSVNIETPVGAIGIRGTVVAGQILPAGQESKITILDGAITFTNGSGTHEMHDSYNTVSLSGYQNAPMDMGRMDAHTFQTAFHSVSAVAGEAISHFSGGAPTAADKHAAPANDASAPQDAAPQGANEHGDKAAPPVPGGAPPVPGSMPPPTGDPGAMMNGTPPAGTMMPGMDGAMMNGTPPAGTMMPGMYGNMMPGMYGNMMPGMYGDMMPGMYGDIAPVMYGDIAPVMYGDIAPVMYGDMMPDYYGETYITPMYYIPPPDTTYVSSSGGTFNIGFAFSPLYNEAVNIGGVFIGAGIGEFTHTGTVVGRIMPFNASAGAITYNIAVNLATPVWHINPFLIAHTDPVVGAVFSSSTDLLSPIGIANSDSFSLRAGAAAPVVFTLTSGQTIQNLVNQIDADPAFHAELISGRLFVSTTNGTSLTVANTVGTPATALFSAANLGVHPAVHEYSLSNINPVTTFSVDGAGNILVNDPLALSHFVNPAGFNLTITATDGAGHTSVLNQHIDIKDYQPGIKPIISDSTNIFGTTGAELLVGTGNSNMNIYGNGGADVIIGNQGDNVISIRDASFRGIDGDGGVDKLSLSSTASTPFMVDFTTITGVIEDIEIIDLGTTIGNTSGNYIKLDLESVFEMTGPLLHTLTIVEGSTVGTAGSVTVVTSGATNTFQLSSVVGSMTYYTGVYQDATMPTAATVTLVIDQTLHPITITAPA